MSNEQTTPQVIDPQTTPQLPPQNDKVAQTASQPPDTGVSAIHDFTYANQATPTDTVPEKGPDMPTPAKKFFLPLCIVVIVAGMLTGFGIHKLNAQTGNGLYQGQPIQAIAADASSIKNGQVFGSADENSFKDSAEGYVQAGGIDGEGTDHLVRPGGADQTAYLVSSVTDLSKFEGMQVKVWGDTFKGQKAGWLMDVGRVQVINTKGTPPTE